jgi:superfamily II DNA/RNA helicase
MELRPYQQAAINMIVGAGNGGHLIIMATGTGKTITMSEALRLMPDVPTLWVAHREELIEQAQRVVPSNVLCETIQTVVRRLESYDPFSVVVIDEAHHTAAKTYRQILDYFMPKQVFGLTATPNRADGYSLADVFQQIIFEYQLPEAVREAYLARPVVRQIRTGVNLDAVKTRLGDYDTKELERTVNTDSRNNLIKDIVAEVPKPCMIFAVDVKHAQTLADLPVCEGAVALSGKTPKTLRKQIYDDFLNDRIPCLINCQLYTEGADFPNLRTVIIARPTQSHALYIQMAGRVLRILPERDKREGLIVDLVDGTSKFPPCQAPCLIGLDPISSKGGSQSLLSGDLLDEIPAQIEREYSTFEAIIRTDKIIADWAKRNKVDTRQIAFVRRPDGSLYLMIPHNNGSAEYLIPPLKLNEPIEKLQERIDAVYRELCTNHSDCQIIWNKRMRKGWGAQAATENQRGLIARYNVNWCKPNLTRDDASKLVTHIRAEWNKRKRGG